MTLRAPRDADFDAILELMNAHQLAAYGEADVTADELRTWLTTPSIDPERDVRVLDEDGRIVGYVDADKTSEDPPRWWSDVKLAPDADVGLVLPELLAWLDDRAESGLLRVWTGVEDRRVLDAFAEHGFEESRHSYRMEISLEDEPPEPKWPDGIVVRAFHPDDERTLYEVHTEVWQDTSDPWDESFEEWQHWLTKREGFDPSLWFLAHTTGDELVAYSLCRPDDIDPNAGYVNLLGVRRSWRRQGLGEALLLHSFRVFRERGFTRGTLGVDASSPTGATRLYERAGMEVYRDTVFLDRPARGS
jgi:mycothiol synthase